MILTRSPLRISLGGGGTDLPSYYQNNQDGGYILAVAINKYVFCALNKPFSEEKILKYSEYERVENIEQIRNPIIRESLRLFPCAREGIEISTMADLPAGTGLGSSGSFTTALLKALSTYSSKPIHALELAELACKVELDLLKEPIGKQDQYIAAHGGFTEFYFRPDGTVHTRSIEIEESTMHDLEDNLLLFYTGKSRSASAILKDQDDKSRAGEKSVIENLDFIKKVGIECKKALENGDTRKFGELMNLHWEHKRVRSTNITNIEIDEAYNFAIKNGATGGKLVGAGGGGFLLFYAHDRDQLRKAMAAKKLKEVRFGFDFDGTKVVLS